MCLPRSGTRSVTAVLSFDPIAEARRHWERRGWEDAADGMAVVTSVMRAQQIFLARTEAVLRPMSLTFARYEVLMLLHLSSGGRLPLGKIGERLQVHAASVTNAIDRLEASDLVERRPNPRDGRGTLAVLTARGRSVAEKATQAVNDVFREIELTPTDQRAITDALARLRRNASDFT